MSGVFFVSRDDDPVVSSCPWVIKVMVPNCGIGEVGPAWYYRQEDAHQDAIHATTLGMFGEEPDPDLGWYAEASDPFDGEEPDRWYPYAQWKPGLGAGLRDFTFDTEAECEQWIRSHLLTARAVE